MNKPTIPTSAAINKMEGNPISEARSDSVTLSDGSNGVYDFLVSLDNEAEVLNWTSRTKSLDLIKSGNNYTLVYENDPETRVLEFVFDGLTGGYQVAQYHPIDPNVASLSQLGFSVVAKSTDGFDIHILIEVTIEKGNEIFVTNGAIKHIENQSDADAGFIYGYKTGRVNFRAGVNGVEKVEVDIEGFNPLSHWTSKGKQLQLIGDGNDVVLAHLDDPNTVVLEFEFDEEVGEYSVEQLLPIDQTGFQQSVVNLTVNGYSPHNQTNTAIIEITIKDGQVALLKSRTVALIENEDGDYQVINAEVNGDANFQPAIVVDGEIALTLSHVEISEIEANWTSQGKALSVVENQENNSYTLVYKEQPYIKVLIVSLDNEGQYKVEQRLPIEHDNGDSSVTFEITAFSSENEEVVKSLIVDLEDRLDTTLQDNSKLMTENGLGQSEEDSFIPLLEPVNEFSDKKFSADTEIDVYEQERESTDFAANQLVVIERSDLNESSEVKLKNHLYIDDLKVSDSSLPYYAYLKHLADGTVVTNISNDGDRAIMMGGAAYSLDPLNIPSALPLSRATPMGGTIIEKVDLIVDYSLIESGALGIIPPKGSDVDFQFGVELRLSSPSIGENDLANEPIDSPFLDIDDHLLNIWDSDGTSLFGTEGDSSEANDFLEGGAGDDQIIAGSEEDIIQGGLGNDILTGGTGHDVFIWTIEDIDIDNPQIDKIIDFKADKTDGAEKDTIDLSELFESEDSMEEILARLTAEKDGDKINIEILDQEGGEPVQTIVLENQGGYTLDGGSTSLVDDLISNDFIKLTNND